MPVRARTVALGRGMGIAMRQTLTASAARLVTAALVAARLAMAMAMGAARLFLLAALLFGQLRQIVRHRLDLHADDALDVAQIGALRTVAKADGDAFAAGARGAADAMDIAFRLVGQL